MSNITTMQNFLTSAQNFTSNPQNPERAAKKIVQNFEILERSGKFGNLSREIDELPNLIKPLEPLEAAFEKFIKFSELLPSNAEAMESFFKFPCMQEFYEDLQAALKKPQVQEGLEKLDSFLKDSQIPEFARKLFSRSLPKDIRPVFTGFFSAIKEMPIQKLLDQVLSAFIQLGKIS